MTIIQLEYLLAVANCGSFSIASEQCFVTQPSLSMQIKNLEEELGVILLDRSRKPVIPTEAGSVVIRNAREAIKAYNYIKESVCELRGEITGTLRLGVIPTVAPYLLHRFVPDFVVRYPKVELEVREMTTQPIVDSLNRDQLDAAIVAGGTCPEGIVEQELFDDRFYAYVSPGNRLYERNNIRIEDIDQKELLLLCEGHCLRNQVLELCQIRPNGGNGCRFDCSSLDTIMRMVDGTGTMTIIPELATTFIPGEHRSRVKTFAKGATSRKVVMAVRRTYVKSSLINVLRDSILRGVDARPN